MTEYATLSELKAYMGITDTNADTQLTDALVTASREVDHYCGRRFFADVAATARIFAPRDSRVLRVDDFQSTSGLIVAIDTGDDATFAKTLTSADYELQPFNNVVDGEPGWPYYRIVYVTSTWPCTNQREGSVQVTAKWGWAAVPGPVKQAAIYLAEEAYRLKDSPFGVVSGDQFGPIRLRPNQRVLALLDPYRDTAVMMA